MRVNVNGIDINYSDHGYPQDLPVVFIHGFPFNRSMWDGQVKVMPPGVRAITYDVRGHGESDVGDGQYLVEFFVDDLVALLGHLRVRQAVVCGLSMGGYIALRTVERCPELVKGLVLADTRSEADPNEGKIKRAASILAVKRDGARAFAEGFVKAVFAPRTFETDPQTVASVKKMIESNPPLGICGTLLALAARTDTTAALPGIKVPTMILVGDSDVLTPPSASQQMHQKIAGSEIHVIPNAAHMSNLENPQVFNDRLLAFLQRF